MLMFWRGCLRAFASHLGGAGAHLPREWRFLRRHVRGGGSQVTFRFSPWPVEQSCNHPRSSKCTLLVAALAYTRSGGDSDLFTLWTVAHGA